MSILRFASIISFWTLLSRILGLVRDMLLANALGADLMTDIFFTAFRIPNLFRRFFADGALAASFIPKYTAILCKDKEEASVFSGHMLTTTTWLMLILTIIAIIFMPMLIPCIAPGFLKQSFKLKMTIQLARIMFPYLLCMMLAAQLGGILNSNKHFSIPAVAPILLNISLITTILLNMLHIIHVSIIAISWSVIIAGFAQVVLLFATCRYYKITIRLFYLPSFTPHIKHVFKNMIHGVVGAGITQINILVGVILSSFLPLGSISYLYYANRLVQLPLALIGIAISVALLPTLTRTIMSQKIQNSYQHINQALEIGTMLSLNAGIGLYILAHPIISAFFFHGHFDSKSVTATSITLQTFSVGLPSFVLTRILSTIFFAYQNLTTPARISLYTLIFNAFISWILMNNIGYSGISLAISLTSWLNTIILFLVLLVQKKISLDKRSYKRYLKILLSSLILMSILETTKQILLYFSFSSWETVAICILVGMIVWATTCLSLNLFSIKELIYALTEKKA